MGRYRKAFTLYSRKQKGRRKNPRDKVVWYYRAYTPDGTRTPGISTGITVKGKAEQQCNELLRAGKLIPPRVVERMRMPTLREWAKSESWWQWDACKYIHRRLRRDKERPAIQRRYADDALRDLTTYILPAHGDKLRDQITTEGCENLILEWERPGLSPKSISNKASVYRIMHVRPSA